MNTKHDLHTLIARKLEGIITPEEQAELETMFAASSGALDEYKAMEKIWAEAQHLKLPVGELPNRRWDMLQSKINTQSEDATRVRVIWWRYAAAVAVLMIVGSVYFITRDQWVTVTTSTSETKSITLPDSSVVKVGGNTRLSYNASDWNAERKVELQGEAFFEVKRNGKSFAVQSHNALVAVLGTSFNVTALPNRTVITCFTGKVSVANNVSEQKVILTQGLEAVVNGDQVSQPYPTTSEDFVDLNFSETPLPLVFKKLAKYHSKKIVMLIEADRVSFSGNLKETSLESALTTVCLSAGLKFRMEKDSIIIE